MNRPCHSCNKNTHHDIIRGSIEDGIRIVRCEECGKKTIEDWSKVKK